MKALVTWCIGFVLGGAAVSGCCFGGGGAPTATTDPSAPLAMAAIIAQSDNDLTLAVRRPDGTYACDDDGDCLPGSQCCYSPFGGARCVLGGQCPCYSAWLSLCGSDADCESGQHCCVRFTGRDPAGYRLCTAAACP